MSANPASNATRLSDLRGAARLATQAVTGVTDIVEGVHRSVLGTLGLVDRAAPVGTRGIAGLVYRSVRGTARAIGGGAGALLATVDGDATRTSSSRRDAMLSILNGVLGDHLARDGNPLAITMRLRHGGADLPDAGLPGASAKVLLLIHGLCMNDLQWRSRRGTDPVFDHGAVLADALGSTPLYLRYNSGLHVSDNGAALSLLLEDALARWPVPVEELVVVAHSMGGLVIRSAVDHARRASLRWPQQLRHIVFLGTPHHGAPLERAGNVVDRLLGSTPFTRPFAALGRLRSAGITDLRHGHVLASDGSDRFERGRDTRDPLPLPGGIACHTIAASTAAARNPLADRLVGDGLVPLHSALGQHRLAARRLAFAPASQWIAWRTNHMQLLRRPEVAHQMLRWLGAESQG